MRLLLDSHVVLWWMAGHGSLGRAAATAIHDADEVVVSVVTPWELGIKRALGKLDYPDGLVHEIVECGFKLLEVNPSHAERAPDLPFHHSDPFDRMLVAQAQLESLVLVTGDRSLDPYEVGLLDARR